MAPWKTLWDLGFKGGQILGKYASKEFPKYWDKFNKSPWAQPFKSRPRPFHNRRDVYPWGRQWFPGAYRVQYDMYRIVKHGLSRYMLKKIISLGLGNLLSQMVRDLSSGRKKTFIRCLEYELPYVWTSQFQARKALWRCFYKALKAGSHDYKSLRNDNRDNGRG